MTVRTERAEPEQLALPALEALVDAISTAIRDNGEVQHQLRALLIKYGYLRSSLDVFTILPCTLDRLTVVMREVLKAVLSDVIRCEKHLADIRAFLLDPRATYLIPELASFWRMTPDDVLDIYHDEVVEWCKAHPDSKPEDSFTVASADALGASTMFNLLRPYDVEIALGGEFEHVRPDRWRTVPVLIRLPRFITDSLQETPGIMGRRTLELCIEDFVIQLYQDEYRAPFFRTDPPQTS